MDLHDLTTSSVGVAAAAGAAAFVAWLLTRQGDSHLSLPPGPKPRPLIGNLLDLPREKEWLVYHRLAEKHGMFANELFACIKLKGAW